MTRVAIIPENPGVPDTCYRAIAGAFESVGKTAGQALDALTAQLPETERVTLLVVIPWFAGRARECVSVFTATPGPS